MRRRRFFFAALTLAAIAEAAPKRESEIFSIETRVLPYSKLEDPRSGNFQADSTEIQSENIRFRMGLPPKKYNQDKTLLGTGLSYEQLHFNYRNFDSSLEGAQVDTVHAIQGQVFIRHKLRPQYWHLRTFISAGFNSDFKSVTMKALRMQGGMLWEREVEAGSVSIGFVILDDFGRTRLFPAIGLEQTVREKHKFSLRAPTMASYSYLMSEKVEVGVAAKVSGMNARLEEDGVFKGKNLSYSMATLGPTAKFRLNKYLSLALEGGWTLYHKFKVLDRKDKIADYDLENSTYALIGLRLVR